MNHASHADLGGQLGHGPVRPEPEGELFHAAWEPRALALTLAMGATGAWNIDMSRSARETLPGYADLSYYEIWIHGLEALMRRRGLVGEDEIAAGRALHAAPPLPRRLEAAAVPATLARGAPTLRPANSVTTGVARFAVGDAVRLRAEPVPHHTRRPGYVRGRRGVVEALHGAHVFADSHAQGLGEQPCWLYTVVFEGRELWGDEPGAQGLQVSIDAWEPYLEPA
ncbi:Low-molecular weight cobalt-containing nitrile hydratase subunit beta [Rubrivivax sp. A210]|uniref:nitrile hydratase subunit beta n=1 Tax=Rubrivivax sp. A210 TaxID=2772301 RepID=UPI001917BF22|nr:nitrile hydratase subunit beta [Rubrivivax sp. A210]CAD5374905.1 Low-molecular weight cobalt-containing nitrile hydratase subunit beta [Rubrivivax sp. A210]